MPVTAQYSEYLVQQLKVLVVDDNHFMRRIVRSLLTTIGVRAILEARDGVEALEIMRDQKPDVVLLDWEMPLLDGPEVVRMVRTPGMFPTPDIPIIMLTGHTEAARVTAAIKFGANDVLCKPVSAKVLLERLTSIAVKSRKAFSFA